jgi:hypothetical protein
VLVSARFKVRCAVLTAIGIGVLGVGSASAAPFRNAMVIVHLAPSKFGALRITPSGGAYQTSTRHYVIPIKSGTPRNYNKMVGTYSLRGALTFTAGGRTRRITRLRVWMTATRSCMTGLLNAQRVQLLCGARSRNVQGFWEPDSYQVFPHLFAIRADGAKMPTAVLTKMHGIFGATSPTTFRGMLTVGGHVPGVLLSPTPGSTHDPFSFASAYVARTDPPAASPIEVGGIAPSTGTGTVVLSATRFGLYSDVHKQFRFVDRTRIVMNAGAIELRMAKGGVEHIIATGSVPVPIATNLGIAVLAPTNMMLTADGAAFVNGELAPTASKEWAEGQRFLRLRLEAPIL